MVVAEAGFAGDAIAAAVASAVVPLRALSAGPVVRLLTLTAVAAVAAFTTFTTFTAFTAFTAFTTIVGIGRNIDREGGGE
ncbi:hypothetical protein [Nitratireductor luteus]|uniref:hypothetical protein n=1 Tax=Nitratireductor luteus TaxID=2976980 RepID=UPI00223FC20D|nr:hypothetical protein [Nitratireductor luteus]